MIVKNVSARPWSIGSVLVPPGSEVSIQDETGVWAESIKGNDNLVLLQQDKLKVVPSTSKRASK